MSRPTQSLLRASRSISASLTPRASSSSSTARYAVRTFATTRCARAEQPPQSSVSPKIAPIVESISGLTLLEVSELVSALKTRLNITEIAMPAASAAPAAAPVEAEAVEEKPKEKTIFTVRLDAIDAATKAKVIREVKVLMPNMTLVEAKKFVESCPQTLKENLPKEDAEKLQKTMQALGATISLV